MRGSKATTLLAAAMMMFTAGCDERPIQCEEAGAVRDCGDCAGSTQTCDGERWGPCAPPAELCDGLDNDCDEQIDEAFDDLGEACTSGEGMCLTDGERVCDPSGEGTICDAEPDAPQAEACNGLDDDCDGETDEAVDPEPCYTGPAGTEGVGRCRAGVRSCVDGAFGACAGEVLPAAEVCGDGRDDDCDGVVDDPDQCAPEPGCGDGIVQDGEACDDGNADNGDGCDAACTAEDFEIITGRAELSGGFAQGAADTFTFTVDGPARLVASATTPDDCRPDDTMIEIVDAQGQQVAFNDDARGLCAGVDHALGAGDYGLIVSGYAERPIADYALEFTLTRDVSNGGTLDGGFVRGGDDLYALDLDEAAEVELTTGRRGGGCPGDTMIELLDEAGARIVLDDDGGEGFCSRVSRALDAGRYRIRVMGYSGGPVADYALTVTIADPEPVAACGNGVLDPGEQCDDGNRRGGDGCRSDCRTPRGIQAITHNGGGNVYFFSNHIYALYEVATARMVDGYPLPVFGQFSNSWPAAGWEEVDAALNLGNGKIYFFKGREYIRFDIARQRIDDGYPLPIAGQFSGNWPNWPSVDAAVNLGNGSAYFFRGREYIRYDIAAGRIADGYPLPIAGQFSGNWPNWPSVEGGVNYGNGSAYFFRGDSYIRYDIAAGRIADGYPLPIAGQFTGNWTPPMRW